MATRTLEITFLGDPKPATKAFGEVEQAGGKLTAKLSGLSGAFGNVATTAAGFLTANVIGKAPGFLLGAANAAAEDEAATERLRNTLRNLGGDFEGHLAQVNAAIDAGQKLAFSDDDVRDSFQFLANATGDTEEALKRQKAAMDLARGANIPLSQATKMLGKLNEENVEAFKKLGITIGDNATEADALAAVQKKFAGQADTYAKSTAGQFAQAKIALGEIVEGIGGAVLPVLTTVARWLAAALPGIQSFAGALGEAFGSVVADRIKRVVTAIGDFIGDIKWVIDNGTGFNEKLSTGVWADLAEAIGAVGIAVRDVVIPALVDFWSSDVVPKLMVARDIAGMLAEKFVQVAGVVADKLKGPLMEVLEFVGSHKEILAAVAIVIGGVLVASFVSWAVAASAAAAATLLAMAPAIAIGLALTALVAVVLLVIKNWDELTAKFPVLGTIAGGVKAALTAFTGWVTGTFVPKALDIYEAIKDALDRAVKYVTDHWDDIKAVIEPALKALGVIIETAWNQFKTNIETALGLIQGVVNVFMGVFTGDWDRAWQGVKGIVEAIWGGIKGTIENAIGLIKGLAPLIQDAGEALANALLNGLKSALSATAGFAGDVGMAVLNAVKSLVNTYVINRINSTLEFSFDTKIPGVGTIRIDPPDIPTLAKGGIVVAGDNPSGIEAIVPLERAHEMGFGGLTFNFYDARIRSEDDARNLLTRAARAAGLA